MTDIECVQEVSNESIPDWQVPAGKCVHFILIRTAFVSSMANRPTLRLDFLGNDLSQILGKKAFVLRTKQTLLQQHYRRRHSIGLSNVP